MNGVRLGDLDMDALMDDMLRGMGEASVGVAEADEIDRDDYADAVPAGWGKVEADDDPAFAALPPGLQAMLNSPAGSTTVVSVNPHKPAESVIVVNAPPVTQDATKQTGVIVVSSSATEARIARNNAIPKTGIINATGEDGRDRVEKYLGWQVERTPMFLPDGSPVKTHMAQVRSDNQKVLGVVTAGFQTIQNSELLALADAVRNDNKLQFANAGMVDGGSRVFFQCKGDSFDIGGGSGGEDVITPYMLFCNGHDGSLSCRMVPMTERMFCQNQLGNIVRRAESLVVIRHSGDMKSKIEEAKRLGRTYFATIKANREAMLGLRDTAVKTEDLQKFFHGVYAKHFGAVQMQAKTEEQQKAVERMKDGFGEFVMRFEKEKNIAGATAWNMANAYTWWLQHCKGVGKNPQKTAQRRYESALFGVSASRSVEAFRMALEMAG